MALQVCALLFLTVLTSSRGNRITFRCGRKASSHNMASQKTMRSFFQGTKPVEESSSKKPRSMEGTHTEMGKSSTALYSTSESSEGEKDRPVEILSSCPIHLTDDGWKAKLTKEFSKPYYKSLMEFTSQEKSKFSIYPPEEQTFSAFNLCPFDKIKVVIIGQDPYHGQGQAHGLCFSVQKGVQIPPSLRNVIQELKADPANNVTNTSHGNLQCWARQGVLMLNTCMTVRKGEANSHQGKGWETFTDAVIKALADKEGIVYLLWGNPAQTKCKSINGLKNHMIKTSHPSPLGAYKTASPFMGSKCFSKANEYLVKRGESPIDWNIV